MIIRPFAIFHVLLDLGSFLCLNFFSCAQLIGHASLVMRVVCMYLSITSKTANALEWGNYWLGVIRLQTSKHKLLLLVMIFAGSFNTLALSGVFPAYGQEEVNYYVYVDPLPEWASSYASNAIYAGTKAWEDANPGLHFYQASSEEEADLIVQWIRDYGTSYLGETIGGGVIQVGLGSSACTGQWHPFSTETVDLIAKHEIGHFLGFDHTSDPDSIMYPTLNYRYGIVEVEENLAPNYAWFVPVCTLDEVTTFWYEVEIDDDAYGFDVYFVPSPDEYDRYLAGETFSYYSHEDCYGEDYVLYSRTCEGVSHSSGLMIVMPETLSNPLQIVTVKLEEIASSPSLGEIPTIQQQPTLPERPSVTYPESKFVPVIGTDFTVSTFIDGGSINSISVNPTDNTLIIYLSSFSDGTLVINQPRTLIDAKEDGADTEFVVFANGYFVNSEEPSKVDDYRTLKIYFPKGTDTIEVVGTSVVPEFSAMVYLTIGAGMMSVVLMSLKRLGRNLFSNRLR